MKEKGRKKRKRKRKERKKEKVKRRNEGGFFSISFAAISSPVTLFARVPPPRNLFAIFLRYHRPFENISRVFQRTSSNQVGSSIVELSNELKRDRAIRKFNEEKFDKYEYYIVRLFFQDALY